MNLLNLNGKIAIVTGGAKGLGAATARMLEQAGAHVTVFDVEPAGGTAVDVTSEQAVMEAMARVAERSGGVDILVNNAGRVARKPAVDLSVEEWDAVVKLNLTATFVCSRAAHPYMKARGGGPSSTRIHHGAFRRAFSQRVAFGVKVRREPDALALGGRATASRQRGRAYLRQHGADGADLFGPREAEHGDAAHAAGPASRPGRCGRGDFVSVQRCGAMRHRYRAAGGFRVLAR
jgi:hypothetical protein